MMYMTQPVLWFSSSMEPKETTHMSVPVLRAVLRPNL